LKGGKMIKIIWKELKRRIPSFFVWEGILRAREEDRMVNIEGIICGEVGREIVIFVLYENKIVVFYNIQLTYGAIMEYLEKDLSETIEKIERFFAQDKLIVQSTQCEIVIGNSVLRLPTKKYLSWAVDQIINYIKRS